MRSLVGVLKAPVCSSAGVLSGPVCSLAGGSEPSLTLLVERLI